MDYHKNELAENVLSTTQRSSVLLCCQIKEQKKGAFISGVKGRLSRCTAIQMPGVIAYLHSLSKLYDAANTNPKLCSWACSDTGQDCVG